MGILLGLLTALAWGSSDFLARFAARKLGTFRAMLYMQLSGLLMLTVVLQWLGGWDRLIASGWKPWAWGICAGAFNTGATLALYRSFEIGKLSIVAPISASYPALTMLLAASTGERLTALRLAGLLLILLGVVIVCKGEPAHENRNPVGGKKSPREKRPGVGWAFLAAFGFGLLFYVLGIRAVPLLGSAQAVWVIRLTCVVLTTLVMLIRRQPKTLPPGDTRSIILGMGLLDTAAYVLNNYGMRLEQVSVLTVLSSLYGAVTIGLAATVLGERVTRPQWAGIVAVFAGIVLISR